MSRPMPQISSLFVVSAIRLSPVVIKIDLKPGTLLNFWKQISYAIAMTFLFHALSFQGFT